MDVGSSRTAANVVGTVQGSLKSLVIDLAVLLEGHSTVRILPSASPYTLQSSLHMRVGV